MIKLKPVKPRGNVLNFARVERGVRRAMEEARDGALQDCKKTTATWNNPPQFAATATRDGYAVGTDDPRWKFVDEGTKPHIIAPKKGKVLRFSRSYAPKTRPRVIGSTAGGPSGDAVFVGKPVHHPGTEAREFTETIREKWQREIPLLINEAIGDALGGLD